MKLKKIASLMLAGIMAVSMLAACGEGTGDNNGGASSSETPATGVSATFAGYLKNGDRVDFDDNNVYQNYLASAIEKRDLNYSVLGDVDNVEVITSGDLYQNVKKLFNDGVIGYKDTTIDNLGAISDKIDTTFTTLYQAPGSMEEDVVLKAVAGKLDDKFDKDILVNFSSDGDNTYDYDYTGSVSMQKVEDGSASAWFVLVTLSVDVAKTGK